MPTVNLGQEIKKSTNAPCTERAIRKEKKEMVASLLASTSFDCDLPSTSNQCNYHLVSKHESESNLTNDICADEEIQDLPQIPSAMQTTEPYQIDYEVKYKKLLRKYSILRTTSRKKIKKLEASLAYYKNKYYNCSNF